MTANQTLKEQYEDIQYKQRIVRLEHLYAGSSGWRMQGKKIWNG